MSRAAVEPDVALAPAAPLWTLSGLGLSGDPHPRLQDVTAEIPAGCTAVIGYSGAGKTSLLNLLVGMERPTHGSLAFRRSPESRLPLFWVPQDHGLWPHLTVLEHLATVAPVMPPAERETLLAEFDLQELAAARPGRLSWGERARLSVARALASQAAVLVMDEPFAHVDPIRAPQYAQRLRATVTARDSSLVFSTHVPELVLALATWVLCLKDGRLLWSGPVETLYHAAPTAELAAFLGPVNWLPPAEAEPWQLKRRLPALCLRPERLTIRRTPEGRFLVESEEFFGSYAAVRLHDPATGARQQFYHRPPAARLQSGDRVVLERID